MKALRIISRNIRDSFKGVFRNFSLSLASISCITITLIVVVIAIVLSYNVNNFAENVEKDVTIVVFLDVDITPEKTDDVLEAIKRNKGIATYTYQSKTDIANDWMESSEVYKNIMGKWTEETSPLPSLTSSCTYAVKTVPSSAACFTCSKPSTISYFFLESITVPSWSFT